MSLVGTQLGHYRLTQFINGGGMGEVYLAEDLSLSRQVAIKVMKTEGSLYPNSQTAQEAERLFQREMKVIAALDHPNILTLYEAGEQTLNREQIRYMVMPYCPAGSLTDWIKQYHSSSPLSPQEVARLLTQAAEALQHAHDQRILHLDIKPQNFLVRRQQDPTVLPNLLLADFGVAKIASTTKMSGTPRGTFSYMAPEQLANQPVSASDQYALAIMTYELLTGKTPFDGALPQVIVYQHAQVMPDPPSKVNTSLPPALDAVLLKALAKRPEQRFRSVREFAQAFSSALKQGKSKGSGGYPSATQTTQEERRRPAPSPRQQPASPYPPYQPYPSPYPPYPPYQQYQPYPQAVPQPPPGLPPRKRKLGFWWAVLFGGIAGCVDYGVVRYGFYLSTVTLLMILCLTVIIAGFITGRIASRKWTGTLTGCIAVITFIAISAVIYHLYMQELLRPMTGIIIAVAILCGFIGGLFGTIGRGRRRQ